MDKITGTSADVTLSNIEKIQELFPNVVTEGKVDFDALRLVLGDDVDSSKEKYQFLWNGKSESIKIAQTPTTATLRPSKEKSKDWDETQNLYIEGDNLEVLKLLQKTYYNRIKLIYIDPPYNTGSDFIYHDDFHNTIENYIEQTNQAHASNPEANGRFHTDWLNMMYPRLILSRNLLSDDGVIFISIDDNEVENVIKIGNEIYGENNFLNLVTVKTKVGGVSGSSEGKSLKDATEFIAIWAKNKKTISLNPVYVKTKLFDRIKSYEEEGKSWKYTSIIKELSGKQLLFEDAERGMKFYGYSTLETTSITSFARENGISEEDVYNRYADRIFQTTNAQSSVRQTVLDRTDSYDYPMFGLEYVPIKGKNEGKTVEILYKGEQRRMMMFLSDAVERIDGEYYYLDKITSLWSDIDYNNLTKEGDIDFPSGKKPIKLLQRIINLAADSESLVLDFFSGSASTAHAVLDLNAKQNSNMKFIMVQLPELDEDHEDFETICDLGEERIRRAAEKLNEEVNNQIDYEDLILGQVKRHLDTGFKVFKLDSTNINPWDNSNEYDDNTIYSSATVFKLDRSKEDILYEIMLKYGVFDQPVFEVNVNGKNLYCVGQRHMIVCLEDNINSSDIAEICKLSPRVVVFKEDGFKDDNAKINAEYNLKNAGVEDVKCI